MTAKADVDLIIEHFKKVGGVSRTARELGISRKTVTRWLHDAGIETPHCGPQSRVEEAQVMELYEAGKSTREIAKILGFGKTRMQYIVRKLGLSRSKSEALKLAFATGRITHKGNAHPRWNGGRTVRNGYVFIYAPDHPRAKNAAQPYVQEHILVLEKKLGRPLAPDEVGHHINGVKDDNRPENLVAMHKGKHHSKLLLLALQHRIRELEAQ